jgi:hypothetical protein
MDYENIYESFYSKYYTKAEILIKFYLIKRKSQDKAFGKSHFLVSDYLRNALANNYNLHRNEKLKVVYELFGTRYNEYEDDHIRNIFAKEVKTAFEKIQFSELPTNYSYSKFIKEIAIIEVVVEISRLLVINSNLLEMFYIANVFDDFEIREHREISLEHYPVYKKLHQILNPEYYETPEKEINLLLAIENTEFKEKTPFKVALKFATGEAQMLHKKFKDEKGQFKIICLELGFKESDRPYFSDTFGNTTDRPKNIFKRVLLMKQVVDHCNSNQIEMCKDFLEKFNKIVLE